MGVRVSIETTVKLIFRPKSSGQNRQEILIINREERFACTQTEDPGFQILKYKRQQIRDVDEHFE